VADAQINAETVEETFPILRAGFPLLLEFHDVPANLPIGVGDYRIDDLLGAELPGGVSLGDAPEEMPVAGIGWEVCGRA